MACLSLTPGPLLPPPVTWQNGTAPVTTPAGVTITHTPGGPAPGILIQKGGTTEFFPKPASGNLHFMTFGTPANFILVLIISDVTAGVTANRTVVLIDTTGAGIDTEVVFDVPAPSTASLPAVMPSQGPGNIFLIMGANGTGSLASIFPSIHRSDNGATLCSAVSFTPSAQVSGEITATSLIIKEGSAPRATCPRPLGESQVTPDPGNFPDAVLGAGVPAALSTTQLVFTIRNTGDDCLVVNDVTDVAPYEVISSSPAFPVTLDANQTMTVTVRFAPTSTGNFNRDLPIVPTPPGGDLFLECRGEGRNAVRSLSFAGTLAFGAVPVSGGVRTLPLTITNSGEAAINVSLPGSAAGEFQWGGFNGSIAVGASAPAISVTFDPAAEGARSGSIPFTSDATASPHQVNLTGTGCIPRALIQVLVPPGPAINFSTVQRGFRMVRIVRVRNAGNGPLNFRATVGGSALWGVQHDGGSITSPAVTRDFTVSPATVCGAGATGTGEVAFAVVFFADGTPGTVTGALTIDNHNAQGGEPATFTFPLQAEIIEGIAVDVELVLDRSGSMGETSGSRTKVATAIDAAHLFVQLGRAGVGDRLGLVKFSTVPEVFSSIAEITTGSQSSMVAAINPSQLAPAGNTSIAGGVIEALRNLAANPRPTAPPQLNKALLVLTDGHDNSPYLNPDDGVTYSLLGGDGTTALPVPAGVRVYAVGIGDSIDVGRLSQLAQATAGEFLPVREATGEQYFEMEKHFTQVYMDTVELSTILDPVYTIQAGQEHRIDFEVLRGDVSAMVVIYDRGGVRLPFRLRTPSGETVGLGSVPPGYQVRPGVTGTARFLEVRMPAGETDRYAGTWTAIIKHDGQACFTPPRGGNATVHVPGGGAPSLDEFGEGFRPKNCQPWGDPLMYGIALGVGSNFRMIPYVDPSIIHVGEPIRLNAVVSEFGLPVTGCSVTVTSEAPDGTQQTLPMRDDGAHQDDDADDGNYGATFTQTWAEGNYIFTFRATGYSRDGEPVYRESVRGKYVEGRTPLVPERDPGGRDPDGGGPDGGGGRPGDECCRLMQRWMLIGCLLLFFILIVLLLILWQ